MVNLLNLTAAVAAASNVWILDNTQKFALDVVAGGCTDYTTVQAFTYLVNPPTPDQQWVLDTTGADLFQIVNPQCNTFLTYTGSVTGANAVRAQATTMYESNTVWKLSPINNLDPTGPFQLIESVSGQAITIWGADSSVDPNTSPVTLEPNRPSDPRQHLFLADPTA